MKCQTIGGLIWAHAWEIEKLRSMDAEEIVMKNATAGI
jgi:hypothetical protein